MPRQIKLLTLLGILLTLSEQTLNFPALGIPQVLALSPDSQKEQATRSPAPPTYSSLQQALIAQNKTDAALLPLFHHFKQRKIINIHIQWELG